VVAQVQVTVPLTATVSTAGLADPFRPLLKKMFPTVTATVLGAAPPVPPPGGGVVGLLGLVGVLGLAGLLGLIGVELLSLQPASTPVANSPLTSTIM
jgi:hypothetical protein